MAISRSENMRRIRSKDTNPELRVRSTAHKLGFRFRLHKRGLPGKPDLVFHSRKKIIFVHGCFWHGHNCRSVARTPKTNTIYWVEKIRKNINRDLKIQAELMALGWDILILWECVTENPDLLKSTIKSFLEPKNKETY